MKRNYFKRLFLGFFMFAFVILPMTIVNMDMNYTSAEETVKLEVSVSDGGVFRISLGEEQPKEVTVDSNNSYSTNVIKGTSLVITAEADDGYGIEYIKRNGEELNGVTRNISNFSNLQDTDEDMNFEVKFVKTGTISKKGEEKFEDNEDYVSNSISKTSLSSVQSRAGNLTVTNVQQVRCDVPNSLYLQNELFTLSNGKIAFCAENREATPQTGMTSVSVTEMDRADLRKIVYYGYGGPGNILGQYGTGAACITSESFSYLLTGTSVCLLGYMYKERFDNFIRPRMNEMLAKPDPAQYGFKIYLVQFDGMNTSWMGEWRPYQKLVYGEFATGNIKISKSSSNTSITDGNSCYTLEGAKYGLYSNSNCTNKIGDFTIDKNGNSNVIQNLTYGTYYIKETKAPTGYDLDGNVYTCNVNGSTTFTVNVKEKPHSISPPILVSKQDSETGMNPQGSGTLKDAEFTIKYYKVYSDNPTGTPAKTWVFKTNSQGLIELKSQYKVSGDDFYYENGNPVLPYGTITIQETKAPNGYHLDSTVYVKQNKPQSIASTTNVKDLVTRVKLVKIQSGNGTKISDARFRHTLPNGKAETVTTNGNGEVILNGLQVGIHKLVEVESPNGYDLNKTEIVFEVDSKGNVIPNNLSELNKNGIDFVLDEKNNGTLTVEDKVSPFDLKINKVNEKGKKLAGAEFTLYSDANCTKALQRFETDDEGVLTFSDLQTETTYYFKETKAPQGYRIPVDSNGNVEIHEIRVDSTPQNNVFNFTIDGNHYRVSDTDVDDPIHLEGTKKDRIVSVQVINFTGKKLPITGSSGLIETFVSSLVILLSLILIVLKKKRLV